ncbi:MAG: ligand-binding sensor domain-containing protein, partial [Limisphaerales bacterium]
MIPSAVKLSRLVLWIGVISAFTFFSSSTMASSNSTWFTRVWQIDDGLLDNNVNQVVQSRDDYLWLVMPVGVMQFDGNSFRPFRMAEFVPTAASHVRMILRGRAGVLWMASDGGNIIRLNPDFSAVTLVETNLPRTVFVPNAWDEAGDGSLWLGYPDAIFRIQNGPAMKLTAKEGVPSGVFHTLHSDGVGNIWMAKGAEIGFFRNGLFCRTASMQGVQCMAATHTNAIWFVAGQYLFTCDTDGKLRNCGAFQNSIAARTAALLEDHTGAVWIGTDGKGLFRYNGSGFERIETSHAFVLSLAEDREGDIWAGTGGGGLDRVTSSGMRLETMENNQIRPQIESICRDADGVLWGATQNGTLVSRINNQWEPTFTNAPFAGTVTCVAAGGGAVWAGTQNGKLVRLGNTNHAIWETNVGHFAICGLLPTSKGDLWIVGERVLQCFHKGQIENIKLPQDFRNYAIVEDADGYVWLGGDGTLICYNGDSLIYQISSKRAARLGLLGHPICCLYTTADGGIWIGSRGGGLVRIKNGRAEQLGRSQGLVDDYISQIVEDKRGWLWFGSNHGIFKIKKLELDLAMEDHRIHLRPIVYGEDEGLASLEALYSVAPPYVFPRAILDNDGCVRILTYKGVVVANPAVMSGASAPPPVLLTQVVMDEQIIAAYGGVVSFETATNLKVLNTPLRLPPSHRHLE